jgi:hypothetical protein
VLAISLDGIPSSHDRIRGSERAFELIASRLEGLRASGIPFGFVFTLTSENLHELAWVCEFASRRVPGFFRCIRSKRSDGAQTEFPGLEPDDVDAAVTWLSVLELQRAYAGRIAIQLDLVDADRLRAEPASVFAEELNSRHRQAPLAELISPLIIESEGYVVPLEHGFPKQFGLGNLHVAPLRLLAERWRANRLEPFLDVCRQAFVDVTGPTDLGIVNWYRAVAHAAEGTRAA